MDVMPDAGDFGRTGRLVTPETVISGSFQLAPIWRVHETRRLTVCSGRRRPRTREMASTDVEFNKEKAGEYDDHPMVKFFPPVFLKLLHSWDWYKSPQPLNVLDYGAGTGLNTFEFVKQGHIVTAADVSPHMLDVLRSKLESSPSKDSVTVVQVPPPNQDGWWKTLPSDHFDIIFMVAVLHHVAADQQQEFIVNLSKLLKVGGRICVIEFEDSERSRAARASFHQKNDDHEQHHGDHHQEHNHHHEHHHHHDHHNNHHGNEAHGDKEDQAHDDQHGHYQEHGQHDEQTPGHHAHDWLTRDGLASYMQHGGLTISEAQLFEVSFDNGHTLDCFFTIGTRS